MALDLDVTLATLLYLLGGAIGGYLIATLILGPGGCEPNCPACEMEREIDGFDPH